MLVSDWAAQSTKDSLDQPQSFLLSPYEIQMSLENPSMQLCLTRGLTAKLRKCVHDRSDAQTNTAEMES